MNQRIVAFLIALLATVNAVEFDAEATQEQISTWSLQSIAYGVLGLLAMVALVAGLVWKCVVSPALDATWSTVTATLWIAAISLFMAFFTLMLWFIT